MTEARRVVTTCSSKGIGGGSHAGSQAGGVARLSGDETLQWPYCDAPMAYFPSTCSSCYRAGKSDRQLNSQNADCIGPKGLKRWRHRKTSWWMESPRTLTWATLPATICETTNGFYFATTRPGMNISTTGSDKGS